MKPNTLKRLVSLELRIVEQSNAGTDPVDFSVFSDDEIDLLADFAERAHAWSDDDWFERDLAPSKQAVFARLADTAGLTG